jgi:hypothetical protein
MKIDNVHDTQSSSDKPKETKENELKGNIASSRRE